RLLNPPLQEYVTPGWLGKAIACFQKPGFFKKRGRVYIAAGEEEYRLLNPPLQEYVTPGWLGKAIAWEREGESVGGCWGKAIAIMVN
ncbi:MAG: hypothetical protein P5686_26165, partial [Limnospira sp. PMC 1254.20]